jgi:hypothetical protein
MSFSPYCLSKFKDDPFVAIPVFPSRFFVTRASTSTRKSGIKEPAAKARPTNALCAGNARGIQSLGFVAAQLSAGSTPVGATTQNLAAAGFFSLFLHRDNRRTDYLLDV